MTTPPPTSSSAARRATARAVPRPSPHTAARRGTAPTAIRRGRRLRAGLALLFGIAASACADADVDPGAEAAFDTIDGVVHVTAGERGEWTAASAWSVDVEGGILIGRIDGPDEYTFGRVAGIVIADDGRIYVGDSQALEVRAYSPAGDFLHRFGRDGEGPGEFRDISGLARAPDGIAVMDGRLARISVFDPEGALVRSFRLDRPWTMLGIGQLMRFDTAGRFYDRGQFSSEMLIDEPGVIVYSPEGEPTDTVRTGRIEQDALVIERNGTPVMSFSRPFSPRASLAVGPDGRVYFARGDAYRITILASEPGRAGDTLRVLRRTIAPQPVSAEERDSAVAAVEERYRELAGGGAPRDVELPAVKPLIHGMRVDSEGYLWVGTGPDPDPRRLEWVVHDPDGRFLGRVELPALRLMDITRDAIAGVVYDELEIARVAVYPLTRH